MKLKIKTRDITDAASEVIETKAFNATEYIEKAKPLADKIEKLTFGFTVYPIEYTDPEDVLVVVGTVSNPKGISLSEDQLVAFVHRDGKTSFPHLFHRCISMKELKASIKANWAKVDKKIEESGDFKSLGVVVKLV